MLSIIIRIISYFYFGNSLVYCTGKKISRTNQFFMEIRLFNSLTKKSSVLSPALNSKEEE